MTAFNGVRRLTRGSYSVLYKKERRIVVALRVGDLIEFREYGRKKRWQLPADDAFKYAVRLQAMADARAKKEAKNQGSLFQ